MSACRGMESGLPLCEGLQRYSSSAHFSSWGSVPSPREEEALFMDVRTLGLLDLRSCLEFISEAIGRMFLMILFHH